jgi:hypothetical protein
MLRLRMPSKEGVIEPVQHLPDDIDKNSLFRQHGHAPVVPGMNERFARRTDQE